MCIIGNGGDAGTRGTGGRGEWIGGGEEVWEGGWGETHVLYISSLVCGQVCQVF